MDPLARHGATGVCAAGGVALSGDFVVHPDEIMQYLEPAHKAVFGNGVTYWEYFYGARQWLVPGLAAAVPSLLKAILGHHEKSDKTPPAVHRLSMRKSVLEVILINQQAS